jgi:hypothetical protein
MGIPRDWWKKRPKVENITRDKQEGTKERHTGEWHIEQRCSGHNAKKRRNWRAFLEENRKLVQEIFDHPETEKT